MSSHSYSVGCPPDILHSTAPAVTRLRYSQSLAKNPDFGAFAYYEQNNTNDFASLGRVDMLMCLCFVLKLLSLT